MSAAESDASRDVPSRRLAADAFGLTLVVAAGVAVLLPALVQGVGIFNSANSGDLIDGYLPSATLAWREVHRGALPLWNPYSALGMPLSFNWHSLTFSVPSIIGYFFPLSWNLPVQLIVTLAIAGSGIYVLGRVLGLGVSGSMFAAISFELSGPFVGWLGLPVAATMAWAGWLLVAALLIIKGRRRVRHVVAFALVLACTIYASQPPLLFQLLIAGALVCAAILGPRIRSRRGRDEAGRAVLDLGVATLAGVALASPLILPGMQLVRGSVNGVSGLSQANLLAAKVPDLFYFQANDTYIGGICLLLAVAGLARWRQRPEVMGFGLAAGTAALFSLVGPVVSLLHRPPLLGSIDWSRDVLVMSFAMSVLAGVGLDALTRPAADRMRPGWLLAGAALMLGGVVAIRLLDTGHITTLDSIVRGKSTTWRIVEFATMLAVCGTLAVNPLSRRRQQRAPQKVRLGRRRLALAALVLLGFETAALLVAGQAQWHSESSAVMPWSSNPAIVAFRQTVGRALVGFGENTNCFPNSLGILQDVNVTYQVHEFAVYDQMTPYRYFRSWKAATGTSAYLPWSIFCPAVTSARIARRYGITIVLEPLGTPGPAGTVDIGRAGYSEAFRVPGAAQAVIIPLGRNDVLPGMDAEGSAEPVLHPDARTWKVATFSPSRSVLRLHLTDVPGWHATIDGRPLPLVRYGGIMLQALVPAGHHVVVVKYWPRAFTAGIILASGALASLALGCAIGSRRARGRGQGMPVPTPHERGMDVRPPARVPALASRRVTQSHSGPRGDDARRLSAE